MHLYRLGLALFCIFLYGMFIRTATARIPDDVDHWSFWDWPGDLQVVIDCHDGNETLQVVTAPPSTTGAGWVLAIPASADQVRVAWRDYLPRYHGRIPESVFHQRLDWVLTAATFTQLYPILYSTFTPALARADEPRPPPPDITRGGLTCSIRDADSPEKFQALIAAAGIDLSASEIDRLSALANGEHCFALIKIASMDDYLTSLHSAGYVRWQNSDSGLWHFFVSTDKMPFLEFDFPAQRPVLPSYAFAKLDATFNNVNAVFHGYVLPVSLSVNRGNPNNSLLVSHHRGYASQFLSPGYYGPYPPGTIQTYTRLFLERAAPPDEVTFTQQTGIRFEAIDYGYTTYAALPSLIAIGFAWTGLCSYLSGGLTGLIFCRRWSRYALVGLWNFTSILGIRLRLARCPEIARPWAFTFLFSLIFLALNYTASATLRINFGPYWPGWS